MILSVLNTIIENLNIPVETGVFSENDVAPETYVVITPIADTFDTFYDNEPHSEIQEARISLFSSVNYLAKRKQIIDALIKEGLTITYKGFVGHDDESGYYNYTIDVERMEDYTWQQ